MTLSAVLVQDLPGLGWVVAYAGGVQDHLPKSTYIYGNVAGEFVGSTALVCSIILKWRVIIASNGGAGGIRTSVPHQGGDDLRRIDDVQQFLASLGETRRPDRAGGLARRQFGGAPSSNGNVRSRLPPSALIRTQIFRKFSVWDLNALDIFLLAIGLVGVPKGIRTPVTAVKGRFL
jgi:hypothetical protein